MRFISTVILLFSFSLQAETYFSQFQQDKIINETYFHNMKGGIFVDIGAHNGVIFNNTLFFEKELDWTGICIEPIPEVFQQLKENRKCKCIQGCVTDSSKDSLFFRAATYAINTEMLSGLAKTYDPDQYLQMMHEVGQTGGQLQVLTVNCFKINDLLKHSNICHVNFLSIDTEGGEFEILQSIDYDRFKIDIISVDDSYQDPRFIPFLEKKGFKLDRRLNRDLIFVNNSFTPSQMEKTFKNL